MEGEYMSHKIKYINNKLYAWCDIREDWTKISYRRPWVIYGAVLRVVDIYW